ncbi:MAG: type II toxin-antitoxin system VapC family toxin [Planctomycetota bacterium]
MIYPDVNLLLYAQFVGFPEHVRARRWWEGLLNGDKEVAIAAPALFGFLRLATSARVFDQPLHVEDALDRVGQWLDQPHVHLATPGPRHLEIAFRLLRELGAAGNLTTDAQLAALAIENQGEVHSNDADFGRFGQLRWVNPLR